MVELFGVTSGRACSAETVCPWFAERGMGLVKEDVHSQATQLSPETESTKAASLAVAVEVVVNLSLAGLVEESGGGASVGGEVAAAKMAECICKVSSCDGCSR